MAAPQLAPQQKPKSKLPAPVPVAWIVAITGFILFGTALRWTGLSLSVSPDKIVGLLAPLAFAAAVIERGVEILISPWRDAGANKLSKAIAVIQARPADPVRAAQNAADLQAAMDELDQYKGVTQQYAFAVSLVLSVLVSISGVRALWPFVDPAAFKAADASQRGFFLSVDVAISAFLLSGGADGLHSVMNAITSFFDASAKKSASS
jgi:hypothetical protein